MQRTLIPLEAIAEYNNLSLALYLAARGKRHQTEVAAFLDRSDRHLATLADAILNHQAPVGAHRSFYIHDPKRRLIHAACFADRVLHHAIMNLAEPRFEQALVPTSFACRKGLGVHAAVAHLQSLLRQHAWVVQVDVDGYFPSIPHDRLNALVARRFKGQGYLDLMARIIAVGTPDASRPGVGLPIGALTSQHLANAFLGEADRFLLQGPARSWVQGHVRYMDDIVWTCASRADAQASLAALRSYMADTLGLRLKDRVILRPASEGLLFCGFKVKPGVVLAGPRKQRRYRQAVRRIVRADASGLYSESDLQRAVDLADATLAHTQSTMFRRRVWQTCYPTPTLQPGCASA